MPANQETPQSEAEQAFELKLQQYEKTGVDSSGAEWFGLCVEAANRGCITWMLGTEVRERELLLALLSFAGEVDGVDRHGLIETLRSSEPGIRKVLVQWVLAKLSDSDFSSHSKAIVNLAFYWMMELPSDALRDIFFTNIDPARKVLAYALDTIDSERVGAVFSQMRPSTQAKVLAHCSFDAVGDTLKAFLTSGAVCALSFVNLLLQTEDAAVKHSVILFIKSHGTPLQKMALELLVLSWELEGQQEPQLKRKLGKPKDEEAKEEVRHTLQNLFTCAFLADNDTTFQQKLNETADYANGLRKKKPSRWKSVNNGVFKNELGKLLQTVMAWKPYAPKAHIQMPSTGVDYSSNVLTTAASAGQDSGPDSEHKKRERTDSEISL